MKYLSLLSMLFFVALCGCGGGAVVKGTVKFDDGTPLTQGGVVFVGTATQAGGTIQSDGSYFLYESKPGDGVTPGSYRVTVTAQTGGGSDGQPIVDLVDPKFSNANTSGLTCDVKGTTTFDITVTKPPAK